MLRHLVCIVEENCFTLKICRDAETRRNCLLIRGSRGGGGSGLDGLGKFTCIAVFLSRFHFSTPPTCGATLIIAISLNVYQRVELACDASNASPHMSDGAGLMMAAALFQSGLGSSPEETSPAYEYAVPRPRSKRSCDFCRKRKTACRIDDYPPCFACKTLGRECSFAERPPKRRRTITGSTAAQPSMSSGIQRTSHG